MKKIIVSTSVLLYSLMGTAQTTAVQASDTVPKTIILPPEQRINKLEAEIANLKTAQVEIQKQLLEIQTAVQPLLKKKKEVVNRVGSKQLNRVEK